MIVFDLVCSSGHRFEAWFASGSAFDQQREQGSLSCPLCGQTDVVKAPMAPRVARGSGRDDGRDNLPVVQEEGSGEPPAQEPGGSAPVPAQMVHALQQLRKQIEEHCQYVGGAFAEEARRIHYGEAERRDIYGEASKADAEALLDEGIEVHGIPWLPNRDG